MREAVNGDIGSDYYSDDISDISDEISDISDISDAMAGLPTDDIPRRNVAHLSHIACLACRQR